MSTTKVTRDSCSNAASGPIRAGSVILSSGAVEAIRYFSDLDICTEFVAAR